MKEHIFFISDLHLCDEHPEITARFITFLQETAIHAEALYILGDFFEFWVGDDNPSLLSRKISEALLQLSMTQVKIYFMPGNRDFLIGNKFLQQSGVSRLQDPCVINIYNYKILLTHGDALCTKDIAHQRFRKIYSNKLFQKIFLLLPLTIRLSIAKKIRQSSKKTQLSEVNSDKYDVTTEAVIKAATKHKTTFIIHGHTHKSAIHTINTSDKSILRIVLGAWEKEAKILKVDANDNYSIETLEVMPTNT